MTERKIWSETKGKRGERSNEKGIGVNICSSENGRNMGRKVK